MRMEIFTNKKDWLHGDPAFVMYGWNAVPRIGEGVGIGGKFYRVKDVTHSAAVSGANHLPYDDTEATINILLGKS